MAPPTDPAASAPPRTPRWAKVFAISGAVIAVMLILVLTGVFGKGHGPGRHMGGHSRSTASIGEPADAAEADRTIEVRALDTLAFEPATLSVSAGETITFVVTNAGEAVHDFTLGDAAMQQEHAQMMSHIPAGMSHDTSNSITLNPGETKRLAWRFGDAGLLEYACHEAGHYQAGMRGRVTIS